MHLKSNGWGQRCVVLLIGLFLLGLDAASAETPISGTEKAPANGKTVPLWDKAFETWRTEFNFAIGNRRDNLDWSIARMPGGGDPNVLSELSWSDVESCQLTLSNRSRFKRHIYLRGLFNWSWIMDGSVRDSDYGQNYHTAEWSRSISQTEGDEMWDLSAGGGYAFFLLDDRLLVAPLLGLSCHKQNLRITNGWQVLSGDNPFSSDPGDNPPSIGPLASQLNSTYFARWMGPWIGCDLIYRPAGRGSRVSPMVLSLSVEIHFADYYGEGNWNLRSDLDHPKSFEHEADGYGLCLAAEWRFAVTAQWDMTIAADYQNWTTDSGTDRKFWAQGGYTTTRLNEVNWHSSSFRIGTSFRF